MSKLTAVFSIALAAQALDYDRLADRIVTALKITPGERVLIRYDAGYFTGLVPALEHRLTRATVTKLAQPARDFDRLLEASDIYLWLPLRPKVIEISPAERGSLARWLDKGGSRRQIHFHWSEGSVFADGLFGEHPAAFDALYESAVDIDYVALAAAQDRAIAQLRSGTVRVRTPAGADLSFRVGDRPFNKQDGDASARRMQSARVRVDREIELPAGVLRVAPLEETVHGRIVIPSARFGERMARNLTLEIEKGRVVRIQASENRDAVNLDRRFREFALGFNPALTPPAVASATSAIPYYGYGSGVVRLSLGDNQELGGNVRGGAVRWFFFPDATVEVDGRRVSTTYAR